VRSIVRDPALAYDEHDYSHAHVVLAGVLDGSWPALEQHAADGLGAAAALASAGRSVDPDETKAALVAFRREHGLIAGDDFRAWREARALDGNALVDFLERELALARVAPEVIAEHPPEPDEVAGVVRGHAICSGTLMELARSLANWAAAARGLGGVPDGADSSALLEAAHSSTASGLDALGEDELAACAAEIVALHAAHGRFAAEAATAEKVDRAIVRHGLGWQRFRWDEAIFGSESAAREAILLVREDGLEFSDVAQMAAKAAYTHDAYFDDIGKDLGGVLIATSPGSLAGPIATNGDGAWSVLAVADRTLADVADPDLRARAERELVADALERHLVGRVRMHVEL
jgi:hypothetical protein